MQGKHTDFCHWLEIRIYPRAVCGSTLPPCLHPGGFQKASIKAGCCTIDQQSNKEFDLRYLLQKESLHSFLQTV